MDESLIYTLVTHLINATLAVVAFLERHDALGYVDNTVNFLVQHDSLIYAGSMLWFFILFMTRQLQILIINGLIDKQVAALSQHQPRILNEDKEKKILIVGDSTAFGTGAATVNESLAGRFAHDFPQVEIHNFAVNGSVTADVLNQLSHVQQNVTYNLTILSTGGNDVWHFTPIKKLEQDLRKVLTEIQKITGNNIALIIYNNIASGPVFPIIVRSLLLRRTNTINKLFMRVAEEMQVEAVPIFLDGESCDPTFFAADGLHPSSTGYGIMYTRLWSTLYKHRQEYHLHD